MPEINKGTEEQEVKLEIAKPVTNGKLIVFKQSHKPSGIDGLRFACLASEVISIVDNGDHRVVASRAGYSVAVSESFDDILDLIK